MVPFLQIILTYWQNNGILNSAIPFERVYTGLIPKKFAPNFPYAVVVPNSSSATFLTGRDYFETFTFSFNLYDTNLDRLDANTLTLIEQFDYRQLASSTIACERANGPFVVTDQDTPQNTYHSVTTYNLIENRSMPV